jgi:transposase
MVAPIDNATRNIVFWHRQLGISLDLIAVLARCDVRTVRRVLDRFEATQNAHIIQRTHYPHILNPDDERFLFSSLYAQPSLFLDEIHDRLLDHRNVTVSLPTISRTLRAARWTNKRLAKSAAERNQLLRCIWKTKHGDLPRDSYIFIDESGVDPRDHHRHDGWALEGLAPGVSQSFTSDGRVSVIPALTTEGIITADIVEGTVNGERFVRFIRDHLVRLAPTYTN